MLIWIGKHRREDNGATHAQVCERCHNPVAYHLIRSYRMVSFNFIPLFAVGSKWRHECPICAHGRELRGEELETQRRAALLGAAYAYATKEEGETIFPVRPSLATVHPRSLATVPRSQAETTENDAGGQKLMLKLVAGVVAAIVIFIAVMIVMSTPPNASSTAPFQLAPPVTPSTAAQAMPPRTQARVSARRSKRTQPRTATSSAAPSAASSALPHADGER